MDHKQYIIWTTDYISYGPQTIYLALQAWVTDFDPFSFKRCHLCSGVRQKNFRPIDMHIAFGMHAKQ